ncbi:rRNA maturation RNase YbeY [Denitratisoma sp. DHT3]|uniref:rRNA maturation RNase YbeY n=1 Tax=Denitratisoma sp. DHT3 TaxID=1981880 RepID=UPI0021BD53D6|nr:rRNA maturation RNase YbeY [Denitratisoma sp. DHT3]
MKNSAGAARPALSLAVQYACADDTLSALPALPSRPRIRRWAQAACEGPAQVTVRFVDAGEGRQLNHDFRGKDYATNVLSFPYEADPVTIGDLVVCLPVVLKEAEAQGKAADAHFAHLIVHGMLHLQGYDHEAGDAEAELMERREREILARLGYPDPYV